MIRRRASAPGDVYWIDPNPIVGREMRDRHRFVVITPRQINALGIAMTVLVTTGGTASRTMGLTVAITGHDGCRGLSSGSLVRHRGVRACGIGARCRDAR